MTLRPSRAIAFALVFGGAACVANYDPIDRVDTLERSAWIASFDVTREIQTLAREAGITPPLVVHLGNPSELLLGQALFFDPVLSGNHDVSCASCHLPGAHGNDRRTLGAARALPDASRPLPRNTPPIFNRIVSRSLLWDGRVEARDSGEVVGPVVLPSGLSSVLEAQALLPLLDRAEMRGEADRAMRNELAEVPDDQPMEVWARVVRRLRAIPGYVSMFDAAYAKDSEPDHVTIVNVGRAIARFEQEIWSATDTPFDDALRATPSRGVHLTGTEPWVRGARLFFGRARCSGCHRGPLLSDEEFHNVGVPQLGPGFDDDQGLDEGRARVTHDPGDRFKFRTPPLRNVAFTAPYFHNGAYASLEAVVRHHLDPAARLDGYEPTEHLPPELARTVRNDADTQRMILSTLSPRIRQQVELTQAEIDALVAFLEALSSRSENLVTERSAVPNRVPSGAALP